MNNILDYIKAGQSTISNLLLANYRKVGLTDTEFILYLQLAAFHQNGNNFPDLQVVAENMGKSLDDLYAVLYSLIEKKLITIEQTTDATGKKQDHYNLDNIYQSLLADVNLSASQPIKQAPMKTKADLFKTIEVEFGRPLSPIEYETVNNWMTLDNYDLELILMALKEAVLNQAYSLKYIDRILLNWEKQNIRNVHDLKRYQSRRQGQFQPTQQMTPPAPNGMSKPAEVPIFHWSD